VISEYKGDIVERDIVIDFPETTLDELARMPVANPSGLELTLSEIADIVMSSGPLEIVREGQVRTVTVSAQLEEGVPLSEASRRLFDELGRIRLPSGYRIEPGGAEKARQRSYAQLKFALLLAVLLVYMVLAAQFESFLHPLTIMLSVPFAGVGVVVLFYVLGEPFSVMAYIGIIMLAGIAVNDAIILVDCANQLRARGAQLREALVRAALTRLRPILMTSLTTILALLPLSLGIGESARLRAPLAYAVIGGLVTSTVMTLVIVPVVYYLFERLMSTVRSRIFKTAT